METIPALDFGNFKTVSFLLTKDHESIPVFITNMTHPKTLVIARQPDRLFSHRLTCARVDSRCVLVSIPNPLKEILLMYRLPSVLESHPPALQDILEKCVRELGAIRLIDSRVGVPVQTA